MSKDKLDDLLQIGAACDWITPLWAILKDAASGGAAHFGVDAYGGFDRGDIRRCLQNNDVESWGYVYNVAGDLIMFSVTEAQAKYAFLVLQREGVPVLYAPQAADETPRPEVALSNDVAMQPMAIVPAPSIWGLLWRLKARLIG